MEIVPKALAFRNTGFKNALLTTFLQKKNVKKKDLYWVLALIKAGADANLRFRNQLNANTPFRLIDDKPNVEYARTLLKFNADPYLKFNEDYNWTAIDIAHTVNLVKLLWSRGVDIMRRDDDCRTLLHKAAEEPRTEPRLIKYFIKNGLSVNDQDLQGNTPLHLLFKAFTRSPQGKSSSRKFEEKLHHFLTEDIDFSLTNHEGHTVKDEGFMCADILGYRKILRRIIRDHQRYQYEAKRLRSILLDFN
jgi:hypothetical protein